MMGPHSGLELDGDSISATAESRFWAKVNFSQEPGACWEWTAYRRNGYGTVTIQGKTQRAHRVAWALHFGRIPAGRVILHTCDNPTCVNPDHLRLGTQAENIADCEAKGRADHPSGERHGSRTRPDRVPRGARHGSKTKPGSSPRGDRNGARLHPERLARGSAIARARFTEPIVSALRAAYPIPGMTRREIAAQFGATKAALDKILSGRTWQHVPTADTKALDALCASSPQIAAVLAPNRRETVRSGALTIRGNG